MTTNFFSWQNLFSALLGIFLISCSTSTANPPSVSPSSPPPALNTNLGQQLPITAQAILPDSTKIDLEVASTSEQQAMGLMYRPALPPNRGMLFPFGSPRPVSFWMKNVPVSLDMVFLRDGVIQAIASNVPPCTQEPCPTYGPQTTIDQVIELRAGRASELHLKSGERIKIIFLNSGNSRK
ncbi:DUF192 domain-containing protein [Calothrix sp. 336/3]|nr:hypothetical protein IJ00_25455 [Calothrix sp. 336/3]